MSRHSWAVALGLPGRPVCVDARRAGIDPPEFRGRSGPPRAAGGMSVHASITAADQAGTRLPPVRKLLDTSTQEPVSQTGQLEGGSPDPGLAMDYNNGE